MKITEKGNGTEVIRLATQAYANVGYSPIVLLGETAKWIWDSYQKTKDKNYLEIAEYIIQAYMELGFLYDRQKEVFDSILAELNISKRERFLKIKYPVNQLKATPHQIRRVLGRWPQVNGTEWGADYVAKDIAERVQKRIVEKKGYKRGSNYTFELIVMEEDAVLLDLERNKMYTFG